jgi:hypothetical protein
VTAPMEGFFQFLLDWTPKYEFTEATVVSDTYGYAGTLDSIAVIDGKRYILDIKTGRFVYPEVALQLAAYSRADYAIVDGKQVELPTVRRGLVLHLRPEGYELRPVRIDDEVFDSFLAAFDVHNWQVEGSKGVVGPAWERGNK